MSAHEPTDENAKQKSKKEFLTLADKKPSLNRLPGNESMSARTISTRELSENLQRTREGMINSMRKRQLYDGFDQDRISEGDDENLENFGLPVRRKPRRDKDSTRTRGIDRSLDDLSKDKRNRSRNQLEEFDSEEVANCDPNDQSNLLNQKLKSGGVLKEEINTTNSQRMKNSSTSSSGHRKQLGHFFDENDKSLTSQNPKKDGPLSTRIFIDAFFPSLEGNRIFPTFNYRCVEKIERTSKNFNERNRKRLNNQLAPVSSSTTMQEDDPQDAQNSCETSTEQQIRKTLAQRNVEKIVKVNEYENEEGNKKGDKSRKTEGQQGEEGKKSKLQHSVESRMNELHKVKEVEEKLMLETNTDHTSVDNSVANKQNQSLIDEKKVETGEHVAQNQSKPGESSADEENLLQKVLRILMENEELIDFFCEKVISKIAARNDFCGPNCKGKCGGLNDPSKSN